MEIVLSIRYTCNTQLRQNYHWVIYSTGINIENIFDTWISKIMNSLVIWNTEYLSLSSNELAMFRNYDIELKTKDN